MTGAIARSEPVKPKIVSDHTAVGKDDKAGSE
jgi:hypothetical protein